MLLSALVTGCTLEHTGTSVTPSTTSVPSLLGTWTSVASVGAGSNSCTNFQWTITSQQGSTVGGTFSAICGTVTISGTVSGQIKGTDVAYQISGSTALAGAPSCTFSFTGTARIEGDVLRVPYSGTTCVGPKQGEEVLRRR